MKRLALIFLFLSAMVAMAASPGRIKMDGAFLRHMQKRDSVLVGDRLRYGVRLDSVADGTTFMLPDISAGSFAGDSLAIVGGWYSDTLRTDRAKKGGKTLRDIEISMEIVPFEEGIYKLQGISMLRILPGGRSDTLSFDPQLLEVKTMQVDTSTYVPHDIRGQVRYPLTVSEITPYLAGGWLLAMLVILIVALAHIHRERGGEANVPDEPAHITALRKLDSLRGNKYWSPDRQKQFYSGVTDALREYISSRYDFGAKEMTTAEIFGRLKDTDIPKDMYGEMKTLFENSDLVKFAKMTMPDEYNAKVIPQSVRFVTETYRETVDEEAQKAGEEAEKK